MIKKLFAPIFAFFLVGCGGSSAQEFVISFGGDVNFARSRDNPSPDYAERGRRLSIEALTKALHPLWSESNLNFVNVETVVAAQNGARQGKTFVFRSHPQQFESLMRLGVNAFGLANNHSSDHGRPGMAATRAFFDSARDRGGNILYAGIATAQEDFAPGVARIDGVVVAMTALGIGTGGFGPAPDRPGAYNIRSADHVERALGALSAAQADIKIVSFHFGTENNVNATGEQRRLVALALENADVDLVLGHHPHVVGPVQVDLERHQAAFYSLGNYVFVGGASKDGDASGVDHGLAGQAYFSRIGGEFRLTALKATPLKGVHFQPRTLSSSASRVRIDHLNRISRSNLGSGRAANFQSVQHHGLMCLGPVYGRRARALCCRSTSLSPSCVAPDLM